MFRTVALALAACLFAGCGRSGFQIAALDGLLGGESDDLPGGDGTGGDGAGGDGAGGGDGDNEVDPGPALFAAAYAGNELWMSYVANDGGDYFSATNQPCTAPTTYRSCVHAGEVRKLTLLSVPSCAGLSASDTLNAFDWVCADTSGGATFYSKLKRGRGLRDLIAPSGTSFASNSVTVSGFGVIPESSGVWFANPIVPLPPNAGTGVETLTASGTIYVETTSRDTLGYHVAADRIGIVTLGSAVLNISDSIVANCNDATGGTVGASDRCLVTMGSVRGAWIEADLDGDRGDYVHQVILAVGASLLRVNRTRAINAESPVLLDGVVASRITSTQLAGDGVTATSVIASDGNLLQDVLLARSHFEIDGDDNVFDHVNVSGGNVGIDITNGAARNVFGRVVSVAHALHGVRSADSNNNRNVFAFVTATNTGNSAVVLTGGTNNTMHSIVAVNSSMHGLLTASPGNTFSHMASAHNGGFSFYLDVGSDNMRFAGQLQTAGSCSVSGSIIAPALDGACAGQNLSSTHLTDVQSGLDVSNAFVGTLTTDDPSNTSDANGGVGAFPSPPHLFDFTRFASAWRAWGLNDSTPFPAAINRGRWSSGAGRIWDWALVPASPLYNHSGHPVALNDPFVDGAPCPSQVHGDRRIADILGGELVAAAGGDDDGICEPGETCSGNVFLAAAMEVIDDNRGDDDYLCEANEACIYAPNIGAYQGSGDYLQHQCAFQDGIVAGVRMYGFPVSGE